MPKIETFNRSNAIALQDEIKAAVEKVLQSHGAALTVTGSFSPSELSLRLKIAVGDGASPDAGLGRLKAAGFTERRFSYGGKSYEAVDYTASRRSYPVTAKRLPDGKLFKFPDSVLSSDTSADEAGKDVVGEIYVPEPEQKSGKEVQDFLDNYDKNWKKLEAIDAKAKANGQVLYRYIQHGFADGYAVYQVIKVSGNRATIRVVTGIGDDWVLPAWGQQKTLALSQVETFLRQRDGLAALFSKKAG